MIDIHTHIAYGIDDGADALNEAVEMLGIAAKNGIKGIVLTPHYPNRIFGLEKSKAEYLEYIGTVAKLLSAQCPEVAVYIGAENYCSDATASLISRNEIITLNNSRYALIEFSEHEGFEFVIDTVRHMKRCGYIPVIAHTERYLCIDHKPERAKQLKSEGALIQVNARSVFGKGRYFMLADYLLRHRLVDAVASDAHEPFVRSTDVSDALAEMAYRYTEEYLQEITCHNPECILNDMPLKEEI